MSLPYCVYNFKTRIIQEDLETNHDLFSLVHFLLKTPDCLNDGSLQKKMILVVLPFHQDTLTLLEVTISKENSC